jgi:hypothetical protein
MRNSEVIRKIPKNIDTETGFLVARAYALVELSKFVLLVVQL